MSDPVKCLDCDGQGTFISGGVIIECCWCDATGFVKYEDGSTKEEA